MRARSGVGIDVNAAIIGASALVAGALLFSRIGYIPMWDGRIYADCITNLASGVSTLGDLRCAQHTSQAYMLYTRLTQWLSPEAYWPMLLSSALLHAMAAVAFYRLARVSFPGDEHRSDISLLTAAFIVQPAILASVVQPGLDLPLVPAFLWCTYAALRERWLLLMLVGTALVFTKETGVLLYAILAAVYMGWRLVRGVGLTRFALLRDGSRFALPLGFFAAYVAYSVIVARESAVWTATPTNASLVSQFVIPRIDRRLIASVVVMLVLTFAWVPAAFIGIDALIGVTRRARRLSRRAILGSETSAIAFVVVLACVVGLAFTRLAPYTSVRYVLVFIALLPLPFYAAMTRLGIGDRRRRAILVVWTLLLSISNVRTLDPASRQLFGTVAFGDHAVLRMTRITGECCAFGRDQLVYNLQFTAFHSLIDSATAATPLGDSAAIFLPARTSWFTLGALDSLTRRRTLSKAGAFEPRVLEPDSLRVSPLPTSALFLGLPNGDVEGALRDLGSTYRIGESRVFRDNGYEVAAYLLTLRESRP